MSGTCSVDACIAQAETSYELKKTEPHEYSAEVFVCSRHLSELQDGAEFHWNPTHRNISTGKFESLLTVNRVVPTLIPQEDGTAPRLYLKGCKSATIEKGRHSNDPTELGLVFHLDVRSEGGKVEPLELAGNREAFLALRDRINLMLPSDTNE